MSKFDKYLEEINIDYYGSEFLKPFLGLHKLSGVDETSSDGYAQAIDFILDGKELRAVEDVNDGYRSMLDRIIKLPKGTIKNRFRPVVVEGSFEDVGAAIIKFKDIKTKKDVLIIGTDTSDDYYPMFVAQWIPEHLSINQRK